MLLDEENEAGDHVQKRPEEDEEEKVSKSTWLYYYKGMKILLQKKKRRKKKYASLLDYRKSLWSSQLSLLHHSWLNIDNMQSANYKAKIRFLLFDIFYKITPYYTQKAIVVHSIKVADFVISKKIHMKRFFCILKVLSFW